MKFLKLIIPRLEQVYGVTNADFHGDYEKIYRDIRNNRIKDIHQGAAKYTGGNEEVFKNIIKRLNLKVAYEIIGYDSPRMSSFQRSLLRIRVKAIAAISLFDSGLREAGCHLAKMVYKNAVSNHEFYFAYKLAQLIFQHEGQFKGRLDVAEDYFQRSKMCLANQQAADEAYYRHWKFSQKYIHLKSSDSKDLLKDLSDSIESLSSYFNETESYHYKYRYYQLKVYQLLLLQKFDNVIKTAYEAFEYFEGLFFDHRSAKAIFLTHILDGYVGLNQFQKVVEFEESIFSYSNAGVNYDICLARLMQAYVNLSKPHEALRIHREFSKYSSDNKEVKDVMNILKVIRQVDGGS